MSPVDHIIFQNSALKQVIVQVRYPLLPRFAEPGFVAPFLEELKALYPRAAREEQRTLLVSSSDGVKVGANETLWRLSSRDGTYAAVLGENAITLEINKYSSIDDLLKRFETVVAILQRTLGVTERGRLGLRYINEFRDESITSLLGWKSLLREELLGFGASGLFGDAVNHMTQEVRVSRDDGNFVIRQGLMTAIPGQEVKQGTAFLLDLDYYREDEAELDLSEAMAQIRSYSEYMYQFFRWTLKDELVARLEPKL